jgi:hypothetical protein
VNRAQRLFSLLLRQMLKNFQAEDEIELTSRHFVQLSRNDGLGSIAEIVDRFFPQCQTWLVTKDPRFRKALHEVLARFAVASTEVDDCLRFPALRDQRQSILQTPLLQEPLQRIAVISRKIGIRHPAAPVHGGRL